jgi:hypothetical protein
MAKLISSVTAFAREVTADIATMPRTKAAWPTLRTGLHDFYSEIKNDLFAFRATQLTPVSGAAAGKLGEILRQADSSVKVEQLLEVHDATADIVKISEAQDKKAGLSFGLLLGAMVAGGLAFGPGGLLAALLLLSPVTMKFAMNYDAAGGDSRAIREKVNSEVMKIAAADAAQVFGSPKVQKILADRGFLKKAFRVGRWSRPNEEYAALTARISKPAPSAPVPAGG